MGGRWKRAMDWHGYEVMRSMGVLSPLDSVLGEGALKTLGCWVCSLEGRAEWLGKS